MSEGCFNPIEIYSLFASPSSLGARNLSLLPFMDSLFTRDLRGILITAFLDSFKIGDSLKVKRRNLAIVFGIAVPFSILIATIFLRWSNLYPLFNNYEKEVLVVSLPPTRLRPFNFLGSDSLWFPIFLTLYACLTNNPIPFFPCP